MNQLQIRNKVRGILRESLQFIIEEIEEEIDIEASRLKRKRKWVNDKYKQDTNLYLLSDLSVKGPTEHFDALRMTKESFHWLLHRVEPYIQKTDTVMRMALPAILKLEIVLHLFATGSSLRILELLFGVSKTSICFMIPRVCDAIYKSLQDYMKVPSSGDEWKEVEAGFRSTWNLSRCCGVIDVKHVVMKSHSDPGNNKSPNKIPILALCDSDYCFKYIDVFTNEKIPEENILQECCLIKALEKNVLPPNHFIAGSRNFPLTRFLTKHYDGDDLSNEEEFFNTKMVTAMGVIENAFGILVSRFRIFERPLPFTPDKIEKVLKTCFALHNWLRVTKCPIQVTTVDVEDSDTGNIVPGTWRELLTEGLVEFPYMLKNVSCEDACGNRKNLAEYYIREKSNQM